MGSIRALEFIRAYWRSWVVFLGPFILSPIIFCSPDEQQTREALKCAYLILLMVFYWLTEALPLPVTSMIPMIGLPLLGLMSTKDVAVNYLNSTNYMFFGGLIMAIAVEHCGLHIRVALKIIKMVGTSQARLMLGFMFTTMFISMWISNTATTAMMLPIVDAVAQAINQKEEPKEEEKESLLQINGKETAKLTFEVSESTEKCIEDENDENDDDDTKRLIDDESFESQLTMLTHGKINSISQLKYLTALDDGCGHFDDLETIVKVNSKAKIVDSENPKSTFKRTRTMKKLKTKQEEQKEIRKRANSDARTPKKLAHVPSKQAIVPIKQIQPTQPAIDKENDLTEETQRNFLLLGIAIAANIGGTGVITGTPPNLVVPDILQKKFGPGTGLTFASWMAFAIPVMLANLLLAWLWLQRLLRWYPGGKGNEGSKQKEERAIKAINKKYEELGEMSQHEIQVLILFIALIFMWFFKTPIFMPGWGDIFTVQTSGGASISVAQATPAIFTCIMLFILPQTYNFWPFTKGDQSFKNSPSLITWRLIETKMCWGVLFLLGGGFALAKALQSSGLSSLLVVQLTKLNLTSLPSWLASLIFTVVTVAITNIASNTATANVFVPILAEMAITMCINPIFFTLPAGIACSYAFALPVSTAPNAIVFGHSTMKTTDMLKAGMMMNLICVTVLILAINTYGVPLFGLNHFPDWAAKVHDNATYCDLI